MPTYTPGQKSLLAYWGVIQNAVEQGKSTADIWTAIKSAGFYETFAGARPSATDLNVLRSLAASNRNASDAFMAAAGSGAITGDMIGSTPNARAITEQSQAPAFNVRFELGYLKDGEAYTSWFTYSITGPLPATVEGLTAELGIYSGALAAGYGFTPGTILTVSIQAY